MKLARFGIPGDEKPALIDAQGRFRDLSGHLADITADSLSAQRLEKIAAIDIDQRPLVDDHMRIGPPVADVRRIICIGLNYKDHAAETHLALPTEPLVFLKGCHPGGPSDNIYLPAGTLVWSSIFVRVKQEPAKMSDLISPRKAGSNLQTFNLAAKGNEGNCYEPTNANE